jgi:hypothetical protein
MPGLSEFTREFIRIGWEQMFDPGGSFFLPDVLRATLDPLSYAGPSPAVSVAVPEDVADSACTSAGYDVNPIAMAMPSLQVMNARIRGLYAIRSSEADLTFSDKDPELTATLYSGRLRGSDVPLTVESEAGANYGFSVGCCVPPSIDSRQCTGTRWTASAKGTFKATIQGAKLQLTLRAEFPASGEAPAITVKTVKVAINQQDIGLDFRIDDLDDVWTDVADIAVQQGIAGDAVQAALQSYFDAADFRKKLGEILTAELKKAAEAVR